VIVRTRELFSSVQKAGLPADKGISCTSPVTKFKSIGWGSKYSDGESIKAIHLPSGDQTKPGLRRNVQAQRIIQLLRLWIYDIE